MRMVSDRLCKEYQLSVVQQPEQGKGKHYAEWQAEQEGKPSYHSMVKADVDEAIRKARLEASLTHTVRCPNCGSMNVEKVSNAERLTSIAMMGPASKKIGKQYKCKNCDYLW